MKLRFIISALAIFLAAAFFFPLVILKAFAANYLKSTDFFVAAPAGEVSSVIDAPFDLYIGDDLSGVSLPVKSFDFVISGNYTGGGSLEVRIDNDPATAKTFILPVASAPTPFELIYQDSSGKINPATAGNYTYTFNLAPSGVSISLLSIKVELTHEAKTQGCPDGLPANEKIKSTEFFVMASESAVSSVIDAPFDLYIGDDLSGITDPVKQVYFLLRGLYTGGGSLEVRIDNDPATAKTFILPVASAPTPFELIYQDSSGKINPATAGTYTYTLNLAPSGLSIYNLSVKASEAHRYKPAACSGFMPSGDLVSLVFDTSGAAAGPAYNSIMWLGVLPAGARVKLQLATSDCPNGASNYPACSTGSWNYRGRSGGSTVCSSGDYYEAAADTPLEIGCPSDHNNKRYFRYKLTLCSSADCATSGAVTPQVDEVVVNWSP